MNFYDILQVSPNAAPDEIKHAFRKLAKEYHPDVNANAEASDRFQLIYLAYDILQDEYKRKLYDELQILKTQRSFLTGRQADEFRRWQNQSARQAQSYSEMPYTEFEDTFLNKLGFHSAQLLAFIMFFVLLVAGLVGIMGGAHFIFRENFNGATLLGYSIWLFGGTFTYVSIKALWGIFEIWRK